MPVKRREEIAASLLLYLKQSVNQINQPGMYACIVQVFKLLWIKMLLELIYRTLMSTLSWTVIIITQTMQHDWILKHVQLYCLHFAACKQDIKNDSDWLVLNLGQFFTYVPYSDLAEFNISKVKLITLFKLDFKFSLLSRSLCSDGLESRFHFLIEIEDFFLFFFAGSSVWLSHWWTEGRANLDTRSVGGWVCRERSVWICCKLSRPEPVGWFL